VVERSDTSGNEPSCRDLPFDLSEPQTVKINLETVERDFASTIESCSIQIFRVDGYPVSKHFI
jgi:hypothetical protein